jgi:hypothetical protein
MPIKRRAVKGRHHKITAEARAIWASGRKELICLTTGGAGMVCCEQLAAELGLLPFIVTPRMNEIVEILSTSLDEEISNAEPRRTRKPKT